MDAGIDPVTQPIPVAPAAHYHMGGVRVDARGRSSLAGLWVCGEASSTGLHGANRLASNSLLEGLVFAERIAQAIPEDADRPGADAATGPASLLDPAVRPEIQRIMTEDSGVLRDGPGLERAAEALTALATRTSDHPCTEAWEATNLHTVATLIVTAALRREETRGSHWRADFPDASDDWRGHLVSVLDGETLTTTYEPQGGSQ